MKRKKKWACLGLCILLFLISCKAPGFAKDESVSQEKERKISSMVKLRDTDVLVGKKIGCTICCKADEWTNFLSDALETLAKYYGAELVCEDGNLAPETQTKQVENMIANQVDAIFFDPAIINGSSEALNQAIDRGIPVFVYDGTWEEPNRAIASIAWDQYDTGRLIGRYLCDYIRKNNLPQPVKILELMYFSSDHCVYRFEGLHEVLDEAEDLEFEFVGRMDSEGNREVAYNLLSSVIVPVDFVISDIDNGAMGACAALEALRNTKIKVLSMGCYGEEPSSKLHREDPYFLAGVTIDTWLLAQMIFDQAIAYFQGEPIEKINNLDLYVIDSSNIDLFWEFED